MSQQATTTQAPPAPRRPWLALVLSLVAPGLGLIYAGRLLAGLVVNLLFLLLVLLLIIASSLFHFFPLYPLGVLGLTWLVMSLMAGRHAAGFVAASEGRKRHFFQHPLLYAMIALMTFLAPLALTAHFTSRHLLTVIPAEGISMYPQLKHGDLILVDRTGYHRAPPGHGDLVAIRTPGSSELAVYRVIATPSDSIEVHGYSLILNQQPLLSLPHSVDPKEISDDSSHLAEVWVEENNGRIYLFSVVTGASLEVGLTSAELGDGQYFVLADNRSLAGPDGTPAAYSDSRTFGAITPEQIEGRPLYVAWSRAPESNSTRWSRIGLPVQ